MSLEASFEAPEAEAEADVPEAPEAELLLELLSASPQWPAAGVSFLRRPSIKRSTDWRLNELFSCLPVDCAWPVAVADMLHLDGAMQRKCIEKWEPLEDGDGQALGAFGVFTPWGKRRVSEVGWGEFIGDSSDFEEHAAHYEAVFQNHKDLTAEQKLLALNSIEKARQALQPGHVTTDDGRRGRADASKRKRTASPSGPASKRAVKGRDCKVDKAGCKVEEPGPVDSKASAAAAASAASLPFEVRDRCWAKFELFMGQEWFGGYVVRARTEKRYDVVFDDACIMRDVDHAVLKRKPPKTKTLKLDGPNAAALLELEKFEINFDDDFVFEEDVFEDAEAPVVSTDGEEAEEVAETDDGEYVDLRLSLKDAMLLRDALPSRPKQQTRHVSAPLYVESKGVSALRRGWWAAEDPRRSQPGGILDDSVFSKGPTFLTEQGFKRVRDQIRLVLELRNDSFFLRNTFRAPLRVEAVPDSDVRTGLRGQRRAVATRGLQKLQLLGIYGGALLLEEEFDRAHRGSQLTLLEHERYTFQFLHEGEVLVVDPLRTGSELLFSINDFRLEPKPGAQKEATRLRQNCEFATVMVRSYPLVVVVTTRAVPAGDELLVDYGDAYWRRSPQLERILEDFRPLAESGVKRKLEHLCDEALRKRQAGEEAEPEAPALLGAPVHLDVTNI